MDWTVIIPFDDAGCAWRRAALDYVVEYLRTRWTWDVLVARGEPGAPWSKGAVVDRAVQHATTDGIIIHDADVIVPAYNLATCATAVEVGHPWAYPHREVFRLSQSMTIQVHNRRVNEPHPYLGSGALERRPHTAPPGGGIVLLSRESYDAVGGIDPRFVGWGGEDISFARALDTLVGEPFTVPNGIMWHLYHEPQPYRPGRRASVESEALASRYLDAVGKPDLMREVVTR